MTGGTVAHKRSKQGLGMNYLTDGNEFETIRSTDIKIEPGTESYSRQRYSAKAFEESLNDDMISRSEPKEVSQDGEKGDGKGHREMKNENESFSSQISADDMKMVNGGYYLHNQFDMNMYPLTKPPLFDMATMMGSNGVYGVPQRRRISISNGQIGQITSHDDVFGHGGSPFNDDGSASVPSETVSMTGPLEHDGPQQLQSRHPFESSPSSATFNGHHPSQVVPPSHYVNQRPYSHNYVNLQKEGDPGRIQGSKNNNEVPGVYPGAAGVPPPNHQLLYNNEVIFNPNNGPIPGTAAWKKEKLLERNRLAASKCRQRKKQAQQQLQDSINKCEEELHTKNLKLQKIEKLVHKYNTHLKEYFSSGHANSLEGLRKFIDIEDIDSIKDEDVE